MASRFVQLLQPEIDWDAIEAARERVNPADIAALVRLYGELRDWPRKVALVQLVQDQRGPALDPVMLDVLRAPTTNTWLDDTIELSKAVALGHFAGTQAGFTRYYKDRAALRSDVAVLLAARGLSVEPSVEAAARPRTSLASDATLAARMFDAIERDALADVLATLDEGLELDGQVTHVRLGTETATPLIYAVIVNRPAIAEALLDRGASVTITRPAGQSALWWAAYHGLTSLAQRLLVAGADPKLADQSGRTPVQVATDAGHSEVIALLRRG